jgi:NADH-quinone oxidoreductase subunit L
MVINRIGDFGLALGIFSVYYVFNSVEYSTVFALAPFFKSDTLFFLGVEIY